MFSCFTYYKELKAKFFNDLFILREDQSYRHAKKDLPLTSSLSRWLQEPELGQTEAETNRFLEFLLMSAEAHGHGILCCCPRPYESRETRTRISAHMAYQCQQLKDKHVKPLCQSQNLNIY